MVERDVVEYDNGVLVVEDDPQMRATCVQMLTRAGFPAEAVGDGEAALAKLKGDTGLCLVLLDLKLPKMDGVAVLQKIRDFNPGIKIIVMTGFATVHSAVQTMKLGAVDYLVKPFEKDELLAVVAQQMDILELQRRVTRLQSELRDRYSVESIVGNSRKMQPIFDQILAARRNKANVLILGESGTGKELIARAIHYGGICSDGPFVAVNCAALPEALIESELFGHGKGAFTGAMRESVGLFRSANGGTILLDEIIDMPLDTQAKLLRVLQERTVRPVGGLSEVAIDMRVIAATNRDPVEALKSGRLRLDLYYRLGVITICAPPLRERSEDIPALIGHFSSRFANTYGIKIGPIRQDVLEVLQRFPWPGNIRELENLVEQWFATGRTSPITLEDLPAESLAGATQNALRPRSLTEDLAVEPTDLMSLRDAERALAQKALKAADDNKSKAANLLGISRKKLYKLLNEPCDSPPDPQA